MKKVFTVLTAALLITGVGFAASETIGKKKKKKCGAKKECCMKTAKASCNKGTTTL